MGEPKVEKYEISLGSHGDGRVRERLWMVAQVVCGWRVRLGAWRTSSGRSHGLYVMEEFGPMCDGGDC